MRNALVGLALAGLVLAAPASAALRVLATTTDLAALAAAVGGELVSVESFVAPGADAEAFEPRPRDLERLRRADLLLRVGLGYDHWLDALVNRHGDNRFMRGGAAHVDASTGVPLLELRGRSAVSEDGHAHGIANPHYWLDPQNAVIVTAGITEALVRLVPEQRDRLIASRERFLGELRARQVRWAQALAPFAGARLIAYHNSWPYFARRFRLDIVDIIEPKPGVAASPAHLAKLIAQGRSSGVRAVLHEPYQPDDASRFVAQKLGVPVLRFALSVGSVPAAVDYFGLIEHDVALLAAALSGANR